MRVIDGPLGALRLDESEMALGREHEMAQPQRVMHLARYLWCSPSIRRLDLSACQPLQPEVPRVVVQALGAGMLPKLEWLNLDGTALPVRASSCACACA